jgi:hypothetical protein
MPCAQCFAPLGALQARKTYKATKNQTKNFKKKENKRSGEMGMFAHLDGVQYSIIKVCSLEHSKQGKKGRGGH